MNGTQQKQWGPVGKAIWGVFLIGVPLVIFHAWVLLAVVPILLVTGLLVVVNLERQQAATSKRDQVLADTMKAWEQARSKGGTR